MRYVEFCTRWSAILAFSVLVWMPYVLAQQLPPDPVTNPQAVSYPPLPPGMRVIVGTPGVMVRNTPSLTSQCGTPPHDCTTADLAPANTYGVIQSDPAVLDTAGWSWQVVTFDNGMTGWVSVLPPYINQLNPPQMVSGVPFQVVGDYMGPALTRGVCINDGANSEATMQLQATTGGVVGTLLCPWKDAGIGNHKVVIIAVNSTATVNSAEFQFNVTAAPVPSPPSQPQNLRIGPVSGITTQRLQDAKPATGKPAPVKK